MSTVPVRLYQSFKIFLLIVLGSISVHVAASSIDYFSFSSPSPDGLGAVVNNQFTVHVLPVIAAYSVLFGVIYYLWHKYRRETELQHQQELRLRREQAVIETTQQLTALMAQYISRYNNEIKEWIESRKKTGQVSSRLETANRNISKALEALTRISYILPYIDKNTNYVKYLEHQLAEISD
jgi:hypothetical protein